MKKFFRRCTELEVAKLEGSNVVKLAYLKIKKASNLVVQIKGFRCYGAAGAGGGGGKAFGGAQPVHNAPNKAASNTMLIIFFFIVVVCLLYNNNQPAICF